MAWNLTRLGAMAVAAMLAGCMPNVSPATYSVGSVGQTNRAVRGTIVSTRPVQISGTQSGIGATSGAAAGAVGGSAIGRGTRSNVAGAIGGAVAGGIAGALIEESATRQQGIEYVVQTENGALLTIVQGAEPALAVGQKVFVLYGAQSRIIADTAGAN